jgi:CheY-like chemotaxis protein
MGVSRPRPLLIVEDDPDIAETLAALLDDRGYLVEIAANGAAALSRLHRPPRPGLILLDLAMPVMDGRQFRRAQLERPELASIPVVVLTADVKAHPELRAADWLTKPVPLEGLLSTVERHCLRE